MIVDDCLIDPDIQSHSPSQEGQDMEERLKAIVFSDDELERILEYKEEAGAVDARVAVLNAISVASDRLEFKDDVVVRCKNCIYHENQGTSFGWVPCMEIMTGDDWFCGSGKRKS